MVDNISPSKGTVEFFPEYFDNALIDSEVLSRFTEIEHESENVPMPEIHKQTVRNGQLKVGHWQARRTQSQKRKAKDDKVISFQQAQKIMRGKKAKAWVCTQIMNVSNLDVGMHNPIEDLKDKQALINAWQRSSRASIPH